MLGSDAQQRLCVLVLTMGVLSTVLLLRRRAWRKGLEAKAARARGLLEQQLCQAKAAVQTFWQKHPNIGAESVVSLSLLELTQKLQKGALSPELVVYSYMEQVLQAQKELNCLTGLMPGWEQQLQELQQRPHRGPLHGIPVSLKDSYQCQGQVSSCGTFTLLDSPAMEDSVIVKVLKSQGAVVFAKTNIPQAMMSYNSDNPIFGNTLNPQNHKRSPGGSSSGEAALIATGASILGMGTDLGGSIRLPASFCGICGFKTTSARLR
ncbi:vitamin D3 hydroxylase-associated protein-like [Suncus etruscus]|uniref:vitamin D3 hydroxylase-associated protein-like n=1 Tax=Suncus etruscus TaxID=109475 RepID=UPI0021107282|nr:vitamin D3 hydroxylase-associated protein-like [Suncus etruscus]